MSSRANLVKAHLLLATFLFPAVLMFLVTGGLYTWGIKGSYNTETYTVALAEPLSADKPALQALVSKELAQLSLAPPTGGSKVKGAGDKLVFEWTGSKRDISLKPLPGELSATLTVNETTWYRNLVQLHKAKGGQIFKVYAAFLAVGLFLILFTGCIMALQAPKYRRLATLSSAAGLLLFVVAAAVS